MDYLRFVRGLVWSSKRDDEEFRDFKEDGNGSNDSNQHLYCTYYLLVSVPSALHILTQVMLTITLRSKCCYHSHFYKKKKLRHR